MLFGNKYSFKRQGAIAQAGMKLFDKGVAIITSFDNSNKPMGERLEDLCAKMINDDDDVKMTLRRIASKYEIDVDMIVIPKFNDSNLLIDSYMLAVPNTQNQLVPAIIKTDCEELMDYLTQVALSRDQEVMKTFCEAIQKAVVTTSK